MISVVIPSLNERENLEDRIPGIYETLGAESEVLVVDGESSDGTEEAVKLLQGDYDGLKYLKQSGSGFANALLEGLAHAKGDVVVSMDAENHDPTQIPKLIGKIREGYDLVIGSRFLKGSEVQLEAHRRASTRIANKIASKTFKLGVEDTSSGYRAYTKKLLDDILLEDYKTDYFSVQVELLEKSAGYKARMTEVPVKYLRREKGESKFDFKPAVMDAGKLLKLAREKKAGGR